jgi:flagellar FliL protein
MAVTTMPTKDAEAPEEKKGGKKKLVIVLVAVLALAGGAYWFVLKPKPEPAPEPGEVVTIEPIQVNLAGGHYLKIGVALQLTTTAHEADGAKALDAVIELFSGRSMDELTRAESREKLKHKLLEEVEHDYHGDVMDLYFTDFVTQ